MNSRQRTSEVCRTLVIECGSCSPCSSRRWQQQEWEMSQDIKMSCIPQAPSLLLSLSISQAFSKGPSHLYEDRTPSKAFGPTWGQRRKAEQAIRQTNILGDPRAGGPRHDPVSSTWPAAPPTCRALPPQSKSSGAET